MSNQTPKQGDNKFAKTQKEETGRENSSGRTEQQDLKTFREKKQKEEDKKSDSRRSK